MSEYQFVERADGLAATGPLLARPHREYAFGGGRSVIPNRLTTHS